MLLQSTGIHILVLHSDKRCHHRGHQHIASLLIIQVHFKSKPVLEPAHLDSDVLLVRCFPTGIKICRGILHDVAIRILGPRGVVKPVAR